MSGFSRYQRILKLFTPSAPAWTAPAISEALGVPASTIYRTLRDLTDAGFLDPSSGGQYRLGPAFIEYDRLLRLTDPLIHAARPILEDIVTQAGVPCVGLLARLYQDQVMCVAGRSGPATPFRSSYERGRPMPLTRGATSKAILASLPARRLGRLIGPREKSAELRDELIAIRKAGYCFASSEIDPGLSGLAAAIAMPERGVLASISLALASDSLDETRRRRLALLVVSAAGLILEALQSSP